MIALNDRVALILKRTEADLLLSSLRRMVAPVAGRTPREQAELDRILDIVDRLERNLITSTEKP